MRIMVATDGKPASLGAIRLGALLEGEAGATVRAVRVVQPVPVYAPASSPMLIMPAVPFTDELTEAAEVEAKRLLESAGSAASWPLGVEVGPVPLTIVQAADEWNAELILMGAGRHDRIDRWLGTETAVRVTQLAHLPVVAVPADGGSTRPHRVVVAVDFSPFSRDAFLAAARIADPGATLHLVYVLASREEMVRVEHLDDGKTYTEGIRHDLQRWAESTTVPRDFRMEFHSLEGKPAEEILGLARDVGADLIAAGSHGMGFFGRTVLGSVSTRLARGAESSILIAPPRERAREVEEGSSRKG